ncbi:MAG: NadR type nicotinamide-nucleotide adenylyltransferase [Cyclobacteriaceae bacterium]|jgi:NadR type nicotinamide-nucleotide adenylyltransferase
MLRRIAVIGPESTGKSELCQQLARHYETEWVPEYARFHLDRMVKPYEREDLSLIAQGQLAWEDDKAEYADKYLFCDTNLIVIKVWSDHKYGSTDEWIEKELKERKYDFYLLGNIDIMWTPDPQREHPKLRKHFFEVFESYLKENDLPYAVISDIEDLRTENAMKAISAFFGENI